MENIAIDYDLFCSYGETKDKKLKDKIMIKYLPFVKSIAKKFYLNNGGFTEDDFVSEGLIGLSRAIEKFNVEKNPNFIQYATYWVTQKMYSFFYHNFRTVRIPATIFKEYRRIEKEVSQNLEEMSKKYNFNQYSLDFNDSMSDNVDKKLFKNSYETIPDETFENGDSLVCKTDRKEYLQSIMEKSLFPREYYIICSFNGLFGIEKRRMVDIADSLDCTRQRTDQLYERGMMKLKRKIKQDKYLGLDLF
jgi:RNA polymerase sigma factor for flagellar operon FliA